MNMALTDERAWRTVFAAPGEALVLVLGDETKAPAVARFVDQAKRLRMEGACLKLVVYGDSGAAFAGHPELAFIEPWARPILGAVLGIADAVVPLGDEAEALLLDHPKLRVIRSPEGLSDLFTRSAARPGKRLVLKNDWGLGDELLLSAVAREIMRTHPETQIWIRSRFDFPLPSFVQKGPVPPEAREVETIYQNATLYGPAHHSPFPGHLVQQMLDKVALDTGIKVTAKDVRPELAFPDVPKTKDPTVLLHSRPNPRLPSKDWGIARWESLVGLLRQRGVRVRQVGGREEPLLPGAEDLRGRAIRELPGIFRESWAVVSVVGFLMHLAEAARTPAVVIYGGREHPAIDGYPDQVHLSSEPLPCRGRWGCHLAPDHDCPHGMRCMERLTPELVAREVLALLDRGGRS
jgi:ADP-heptose:LPS heptosyltransferase